MGESACANSRFLPSRTTTISLNLSLQTSLELGACFHWIAGVFLSSWSAQKHPCLCNSTRFFILKADMISAIFTVIPNSWGGEPWIPEQEKEIRIHCVWQIGKLRNTRSTRNNTNSYLRVLRRWPEHGVLGRLVDEQPRGCRWCGTAAQRPIMLMRLTSTKSSIKLSPHEKGEMHCIDLSWAIGYECCHVRGKCGNYEK